MGEHNSKVSILSSSSNQMCGMPQPSTAASTHIDSVFETTSSHPARIRILENFIVIWLDSNMDHSDEDTSNTIIQLQSIVNSIERFTDLDKCVDFLTDIEDEKVFMIISDNLIQEILPLIVDIDQLHSIYVLCNHQAAHEPWTNQSKKVKGVFTRIESIYDALKQNVSQSDIALTPIGIISATAPTNLDELDPSFMYSQLLKEIIVDIEHDDNAKKKFVNFWRQHYVNNGSMLNIIDDFEQNYEPCKAIWWYTKETFIYSKLNKALRIHDVEAIMKMGFFIQDLHRQIQQLHLETHPSTKILLYRGQGLSNADLIKIRNCKGGLLSFNNFLSTSEDREISLILADSARSDPDLTGILFEIEADPSLSSAPFASVNDLSSFGSEMEILFSMHTVFRIGELKQIGDRLWQINLVLTSDTDQQLKCLGDYMRTELGNETGWHRMRKLMSKMNKPELHLEAWRKLIDTTHNYDLESFATMLNDQEMFTTFMTDNLKHLAKVLFLVAQCKNAPFDLRREIEQESLPSNHSEPATAYENFGSTHDWKKDCEFALSCYNKLLEIQEKSLPLNHRELAATYYSITHIHAYMEDYSTALSYLQKLLDIQQKSLRDAHSYVATTYNSIGEIHQSMEDYTAALTYFQEALEIREKSLPPNHPDLAISYQRIGEMHQLMGDHTAALSYFEKTIEVQKKSPPAGHLDLATTYNSIGEVYQSMEDYSTALSYFEKTKETDAEYYIAQIRLLQKRVETFSKDLGGEGESERESAGESERESASDG